MSDQNINHTPGSLKDLNAKMYKLGESIERFEILAYRYQRLSQALKYLLSSWIPSMWPLLMSGKNLIKFMRFVSGQGSISSALTLLNFRISPTPSTA